MAILYDSYLVQQFRYRKHIKHIRTFVTLLLFIVILIFFAGALLTGVNALFLLAIPFILEGVVLWRVYRRFINARISTNEDSISYSLGKRETVIPYNEITKIQIRSVRYLGGWIKIKSNEKTFRLTVVVENIQSLIRILKSNLDTRNMTDIYNSKKLFRFLKTAAFADESWARLYRIWWKLLLLTIFTAVIGIAITIGGNLSAITTFFATLFPTIVYVITEAIFKLRIRRLSNSQDFSVPDRDISYEQNIQKSALLYGSLTFLLIVILLVIL